MSLKEELARLCPRPSRPQAAAIWDGYVDAICGSAALFSQFEVGAPLRWAHLVATWAHETGGFTILWESGAYSAPRIVQVFGVGRHSARVGQAEAERLAGRPYELFERVYGLGNPVMAKTLGNRELGDGYNFRGLGIQQLTGRWAHETYATKIGCSLQDLARPANSIHGALLEWRDKGCNEKSDRDDVRAVRKAINGGYNGLDDVTRYVAAAKRIWPDGLRAGTSTADEPMAPVADVPGSARDVQSNSEYHLEKHESLKAESWFYLANHFNKKAVLGMVLSAAAFIQDHAVEIAAGGLVAVIAFELIQYWLRTRAAEA